MLRRVAVVRTDVSEERVASIISELGALAVTVTFLARRFLSRS
jgi:hypothetical protein